MTMGKWKIPARCAIESMQPAWFKDVNKKRKRPSNDGRTVSEQSFDSGVFAAAEFIRRITRDLEI